MNYSVSRPTPKPTRLSDTPNAECRFFWANIVSASTGLTLEKLTQKDLGWARKVVCGPHRTTLIGGGGKAPAIQDRIAVLQEKQGTVTGQMEREYLAERISKLNGKVAVIHVGGTTDTEMTERLMRVDDALHATRAALAEGTVPGGGSILIYYLTKAAGHLPNARQFKGEGTQTNDVDTGRILVRAALNSPLRIIAENAGEDGMQHINHLVEHYTTGEKNIQPQDLLGWNAATKEYGDMYAMGILDPVKVLRIVLEKAASIAGDLLLTEAVITAKGVEVGTTA